MIDNKGYIISALPIGTLTKVSDLLFYDGPILSHFKNEKDHNFLFYWVDVDESYNRWLIWKITDFQLYSYLKGNCTLRDLLLEKNKDFVYYSDIDNDLNQYNIKATEIEDLVEEYIPEEMSYFDSSLLPTYKELISQFEQKLYLPILKQNAVYFTLEPRQLIFSTTVSALDAGNFLKKISSSFLSYLEFDFFESFKSSISDIKKISKIIAEFKEALSLRIVDLQFSSFKVAISTGNIKIVESKFQGWQNQILEKYKTDVVEIDYNSESELKKIAERFPERIIRNVHLPLIEIINDKKYKVSIKDNKRRFKKSYVQISKNNIETLFPKVTLEKPTNEKKKLVNIILEVSENEDIQKLGKKGLQSGLLFSQEIQRVPFEFTEVKHGSTTIKLNRAIICDLYIENNTTHLENKEFNIIIQSKNALEIFEKFNSKFVEIYYDLNENASNYLPEFVEKFKNLISKVELL